MEHFLHNARVAALHGDAFGSYGEGYMRFSYATSLDNINKGLERIKESMEKL
jgi:aspartate/methionine/tyrosine aminotransferase